MFLEFIATRVFVHNVFAHNVICFYNRFFLLACRMSAGQSLRRDPGHVALQAHRKVLGTEFCCFTPKYEAVRKTYSMRHAQMHKTRGACTIQHALHPPQAAARNIWLCDQTHYCSSSI
jgi:hypothetical protein